MQEYTLKIIPWVNIGRRHFEFSDEIENIIFKSKTSNFK